MNSITYVKSVLAMCLYSKWKVGTGQPLETDQAAVLYTQQYINLCLIQDKGRNYLLTFMPAYM